MSNIFQYNGGSIVGMLGEDCVGIACDKRFGINYCTVDTNFNKIYEMSPNLYLGLSGLATDAITVSQRLKFRKNMFELRENRKISPEVFASMVGNMLYEKRFGPYFVEPIVAGYNHETNKPFLTNFDSIGCMSKGETFVCGGTASEELLGTCEAFWEPNLDPDSLFEALSQSLLNALERNASSGWGAYVYIIEKDKVTITELKGRMD